MIKIGNLDISKLYLGTTEVDKLYLGTTETYSKGGPTPPTPTAAYTVVGDLVKEGNYYKGFSHTNNAYIDCGRVRFNPQGMWSIRFTTKNTTSHSVTRDIPIFFADPTTKVCYGCIGGYSDWARVAAYGSNVEGTGTGTSYSTYLMTAAPSGVVINPLTDTTGAEISMEMAWNYSNYTWKVSNTGYDNLVSAISRAVTSNTFQVFDSPNLHMYIGALPSDIPCSTAVQTAIDSINVDSISLSSEFGTWDAVNGFINNDKTYVLNPNTVITGTPTFYPSSAIAKVNATSYYTTNFDTIDLASGETEISFRHSITSGSSAQDMALYILNSSGSNSICSLYNMTTTSQLTVGSYVVNATSWKNGTEVRGKIVIDSDSKLHFYKYLDGEYVSFGATPTVTYGSAGSKIGQIKIGGYRSETAYVGLADYVIKHNGEIIFSAVTEQ